MKKLLLTIVVCCLLASCAAPQQQPSKKDIVEQNIAQQIPKVRITEKTLDDSNHQAVKTATAAPSTPVWESSNTLKDTVTSWTKKEECPAGGSWLVSWQTPVDYQISTPFSFSGTFQDAINNVFSLYKNAKKPLYVTAYNTQCLLVVTDHVSL